MFVDVGDGGELAGIQDAWFVGSADLLCGAGIPITLDHQRTDILFLHIVHLLPKTLKPSLQPIFAPLHLLHNLQIIVRVSILSYGLPHRQFEFRDELQLWGMVGQGRIQLGDEITDETGPGDMENEENGKTEG